jgi:hypothetical protein
VIKYLRKGCLKILPADRTHLSQFLNLVLSSIGILIHVNENLGLAFAASETNFANFFERYLCINLLKHLVASAYQPLNRTLPGFTQLAANRGKYVRGNPHTKSFFIGRRFR